MTFNIIIQDETLGTCHHNLSQDREFYFYFFADHERWTTGHTCIYSMNAAILE